MKKQAVKLEFGLHDDKIVHVSTLSVEEKGEKCNCICPGCGAKLLAKLGSKNQWHFAHKGSECNIAIAQQTALHIFAKEIIEENKKLLFPGISVKRDSFIHSDIDNRVTARVPYSIDYKKPSIVKCESVSLEKKISNVIPDVIVSAQGHSCLIEIAVTHYVDEEKAQKIEELGLPLLEIDLGDLYKTEFSKERLTEAVLYSLENRKWVYNPLYNEAENWAKNTYKRLIDAASEEVKTADKKFADLQSKKASKRRKGIEKIRKTFEPNNYRKTVLALENKGEIVKALKTVKINISLDKFPFYLNIPIAGEMIFPCDRRIWQTILFGKFVYNRKEEDFVSPTVHIKRVQKWLKDYNNLFPIDWELAYKTDVSVYNKSKTVLLFDDVVCRFFDYLVYLGFLERLPLQEYAIKRAYSLIPPNIEHAEIFLDALKKVDWYTPSIDEQLKQFIDPTNMYHFL